MKHKRIFTRLAAALLVAAFLPTAALADNWYLEDGDITVSATESSQTVSQGDVTKEDSAPVIGNRDAEASTDNTVTIVADKNATANVTLKDANIDVSAEKEAAVKTGGEGDVTLTIEGENTVKSGNNHAGVEKTNDGNLTITTDGSSQGSLSAEGGFVGSGIGGAWSSVSNITIEGDVQLKATGGETAAGIGSAADSCSNITIRGNAKVEATGGDDAAGIGSGVGAKNASDIIIEGNAEVIASGQGSGAGIGTGTTGDATNITIRGNAKVEASATDMGAGIGGGRYDGKNITIEGNAKVSAKGHLWAAGIGGGANGYGENITIRGNAQVSAIGGRSSNSFGAGIGGPQNGFRSKNFTVAENAIVRVQGGPDGQGFGFGGSNAEEIIPDTANLRDGWIAYYLPDADMDADAPWKVVYRNEQGALVTTTDNIRFLSKTYPTCETDGNSSFSADGKSFSFIFPKLGHIFKNYTYNNNATETSDGTETAHCERPGCTATDTRVCPGTRLNGNVSAPQQTLFRVTDLDGEDMPYRQQLADGVLTVTADAEDAMLLLPSDSIPTLQTQGVRELRFVTNQTSSGFALSKLPEGQAEFALTHTGSEIAFTQDGQDLSGILQKLS